MPERARQLAHQHVGDDHRRQLAAGQHVAADRDLVVGEVLVHPLVEALVAAAEQRHVRLLGQLVGELVVEQPPGRREQHDPRPLPARVGGLQRRVDDVDPQHHPGPAAVGRVVDLPGAERRRVAVVEEPQLVPFADRVLNRALRLEPVEGLREEGEDVELQALSRGCRR